jgi:hypothetical protein
MQVPANFLHDASESLIGFDVRDIDALEAALDEQEQHKQLLATEAFRKIPRRSTLRGALVFT